MTEQTGGAPDIQLLTKAEVSEMVKLSVSQIHALQLKGRFPPALKLGENQQGGVRWYRHEIVEWLANQPRVKTRRKYSPVLLPQPEHAAA